MRRLEETYIAAGQVHFVYQSVAWNRESQRASEAAECANEQGGFWDYSDLLFTNRATAGASVAFDVPHLQAYASALDLDLEAFDRCLSTGRYRNDIVQSTQAAQARGVRATPTFFINGQYLEGAQPFEVFQQIIAAFLEAAS